MNFDVKLDALHRKGVLSEEQKERLRNSLPQEPQTIAGKRRVKKKRLFSAVGGLLILCFPLLVAMGLVSGVDSTGIQDVAAQLNNAGATASIGAGGAMLWLVYTVCLLLYAIVLFLAVRGYNRLQSLSALIVAKQHSISSAAKMEEELLPLLEENVLRFFDHEKTVLEQLTPGNDTVAFLAARYPEIKSDLLIAELMSSCEELAALKNSQIQEYSDLISAYNTTLSTFPGTLGKLLGSFQIKSSTGEEHK